MATRAPGRDGRVASWVIRDKATGEPKMETYARSSLARVNSQKYEAIPVHEYLAELNDPSSLSGKWARR
jgi:hypothetical protein